ncbi:MAG TPA: hypothetical protein VGA50_20795 [Kiloniellales bacterium]
MKPLRKSTLVRLCHEMAAHPWRDQELDELVHPKLGIITSLQHLLNELEVLRGTDLGDLPPATSLRPERSGE